MRVKKYKVGCCEPGCDTFIPISVEAKDTVQRLSVTCACGVCMRVDVFFEPKMVLNKISYIDDRMGKELVYKSESFEVDV